MSPRVLAVIVTYNAMQWIDRCLGSLAQSGVPVDAFVVDNGSTDGTVEHIRGRYPHVRLVEAGHNLGFGAANNIGMRHAVEEGYDYVYLLNQDAWIFPDTIAVLIEESRRNPRYGILSPMQLTAGEERLDRGFREYLEKEIPAEGTLQPMKFVMAAHWFMPVEAVKTVGGFSPTFFHYGEDVDYINRMLYHGYSVGAVRTARGVHDRGERPLSRDRSLYLLDVTFLIWLSDPNSRFLRSLYRCSAFMVVFSLREHSHRPFLGGLKAFGRLRGIARNRNRAMRGNAFL